MAWIFLPSRASDWSCSANCGFNWPPGKRAPGSRAARRRVQTRLGAQCATGVIGLLRLLLFVLAGTGDCVHAGAGGSGGLNLRGIVGL